MSKKIYLIICAVAVAVLPGCANKSKESCGQTCSEAVVKNLPDKLQNIVSQKYPGAKVTDYEAKANGTEVEIRDKGIEKELWLDRDGQWVSTHWEISKRDIPAAIMDYLTTSAYADYKIDDVEVIENTQGIFYNLELKSGNNEVSVTFDKDAQVVLAK